MLILVEMLGDDGQLVSKSDMVLGRSAGCVARGIYNK